MEKKLGLRFGAMCPTIQEQLNEQGFPYSITEIRHFQKDADAITRLRIRGLIPDSQVDKSFKKLTNSVANHIETAGKSTKNNKK